MPGSELFTIIALVEARDRASQVITRMDEAFTSLSESAARTAEVVGAASEELDSALLSSASGVDDLQLGIARLAAARAELTKLTEDQAKAEIDLMAVQEKVNSGELQGAEATDALVVAMRELNVAARDAALSEGRLAELQAAQTAAADRAAAANTVAAGAATRTATASSLGLLGIAAWGKGAMIAGGAAAFLGYEAVKTASNFDTLTTRLVTSANESAANLGMIRKGILDVSEATGTSANDLAKSMYVVESAGYHGAKGLEVLKAATEGAQQEGANFADVANGVTDVLVDYHRPASDAANVTSQLVKAVSFGKSNFQSFSKALANVLPLAAAIGLKLNDVTGVLAEMTAHGMTAQRASFNMANAMRSLEAPTDAMKKEFSEVGITAQDVSKSLSTKGLAGTLQWLSQLAHKNAAALGQTYPGALRALVGTATGLQVALLTTGKYADDTSRAIKGIGGATADAKGNVEGYSKTQQNIGYQMDKFKSAIQAAGIALGNALIPALVKVMTVVNQFLMPLAHLIERHQKIAAIVIGAAVALGILAAAIFVVNGAMALLAANPVVAAIILVIAAIAALVAGLVYAYHHFTTFRVIVNAVASSVKESFVALWHGLQIVWDGIVIGAKAVWSGMKEAWGGISQAAIELWHFLKGVWDGISGTTMAVWDAIAGFFKKWWPLLFVIFMPFIAALVGLWNHCHTQIVDGAKAVWNFILNFLKGAWSGIENTAKVLWKGIQIAIIDPVKAVWSEMKQIWSYIEPYVKGLWRGVSGDIKAAWSLIKQYIINPVEELYHYLTNKFGSIKDFLHGAMVGAVNLVKNAAKGFYNVGADIIRGMISGIKGMVGNLMGTIKSVAGSALNAAKSMLGISSPSKAFRDHVGKWIPHGIAQGVMDYAGVAYNAVSRVAGGLSGALPSGGGRGLASGLASSAGLGLIGSGGGGGGTVIIDVHDNRIMSDRDLDSLVDKIGSRVATRILPAGGVRIRM